MSNYVKSTNFTAKDSLPTGDANKVIRGSEFDTEFDALATAVATKADLAGPTFTGTATFANLTATGTVNLSSANVTTNIDGGTIDNAVIGGSTPAAGTFTSLVATTADINAGTIDNTVIGGTTPAAGTFTAVAGTTGTFSGAVSGTTGTFSGAVTGSNLNISNWDIAFGWGNHASAGYLTSVGFSDISAGAITTSSETFADSDTQIPTNAAVIDYVAATIPLITEVNDLTASVTWANVPDANITQSSVTQHQAALAIAATQLTGNITVPGNVYLAPSGTGFTELRGNTNAGAIRFNCESNSHGVTIKGPPHSASATYELELPNSDGSAGQFLKTDGSGKLSFDTVSVNNITGDVTITGELLADSYNEKCKRVSSVTTTSYYDIANATYASKSLSVSQDSTPSDILFNGDGTKAYMLGYNTDAIYQYSLSTAYDVSTGSYDSVSFSVSSQDSVPLAMAWNSDGTKLYVAGSGNDSIFQYTLSTAYNLSTASYSSVSLSVSAQTTNPDGLFFKPDGTIMYLCSQNGAVYQYTLSTAFDLSTASYASKSLDVSGETSSARGVAFSSDGLKVFIVDNTNDAIDQYNLSTAWDISTGSYASKTFSVTTQENFPMGLVFSPTGDKMYVVGTQNDTIYQYTSSSSSTSTTFDCEDANVFETELDANTTVVFSNPPASGTPVVTGFLLGSAAYASKSFSVSSQETNPTGLAFNTDGTKMFVIGFTGDDVNEYNLSTAFDVSTASYSQVFSVSSQATEPTGIAFNANGTKMFVLDISGVDVNEYNLSTGFDVSTASYSQNFSVSAQESNPQGIAFNTDGTKMFIVGITGDDVNEYTLSTGFDVSTASYSQNFSVASQEINPTEVTFNSDGTKMYIIGLTGQDVNEYTLSTGFDVSTASYSQNFSVASQETSPNGLAFSADGSKMYVVGQANDTVYQYTTGTSTLNDSTAYGMSLKVIQDSGASGYTVTWPTSVKWPSATAPTLTATASAEDQFVFYTKDGGTNWYGFTAGQALG